MGSWAWVCWSGKFPGPESQNLSYYSASIGFSRADGISKTQRLLSCVCQFVSAQDDLWSCSRCFRRAKHVLWSLSCLAQRSEQGSGSQESCNSVQASRLTTLRSPLTPGLKCNLVLLLVFIKNVWIMDESSSINAHSHYSPYSDFQKIYKGSSLAVILAASCLLNAVSWSCGSHLHSVCRSFFLFSGGSDWQRKQAGAVYLLSRIKKPGTLLLVLVLLTFSVVSKNWILPLLHTA